MELLYSVILAVCSFWLGACPFSVWIGRSLLNKDIRGYGDGNPGAVNVFRAGGRRAGSLALLLDIAKGIPFVFSAHALLALPDVAVMAIGMSAIFGHAFSPLLRFHGGKALAVTLGVLLVLPQHQLVFTVLIFTFLSFIFIESDAWTIVIGAVGSLAYLEITRGNSWESLFIFYVLALYAVKSHNELHTVPKLGRLVHWVQSRT